MLSLRAKALGRILKELERVLNQALPVAVEFEFKYRDPDEDLQRAQLAATWATTILSLDQKLTTDEQRRLLASQVEAIRDVITDNAGIVIEVDDQDPKTPEQEAPVVVSAEQDANTDETPDAVVADKDLASTQSEFKQEFERLVQLVQSGYLSQTALRPALRLELIQRGKDAYIDGLEDGGSEQTTLDAEGRKILSKWRASQRSYLNSFVDTIFKTDLTPQDISNRASMWVNKSLNTMYFAGLRVANKEQRYMWVMNPRKEHCRTCLKLNGQIHRMKAYINTNLLPQSSELECGGWLCGCSLVATDKRARGRLPKTKSKRILQ